MAKKVVTKKVAKVGMTKAKVQKEVEKQLSSAKKSVKKAVSKNVQQDAEIAKLKEDLASLKTKKKVNSRRISEYNLFIRKQINSGLTFARAVKEWNKYKALESKNTRRPSAYNQFIGSQMRLGKTFQESIKLWTLAKSGKLGKKGTTRTITKTVVRTRTVKSKPKIVVKTVRSKPRVVEKVKYRTRKAPVEKKTQKVETVDYEKLMNMFASQTVTKREISQAIDADDEEIAFKIVQTYFKEIARFGFKKQLTLDEIINAYLYSLARVKKIEHEERALEASIKESGMKK